MALCSDTNEFGAVVADYDLEHVAFRRVVDDFSRECRAVRVRARRACTQRGVDHRGARLTRCACALFAQIGEAAGEVPQVWKGVQDALSADCVIDPRLSSGIDTSPTHPVTLKLGPSRARSGGGDAGLLLWGRFEGKAARQKCRCENQQGKVFNHNI
jgi:hypothetical protein